MVASDKFCVYTRKLLCNSSCFLFQASLQSELSKSEAQLIFLYFQKQVRKLCLFGGFYLPVQISFQIMAILVSVPYLKEDSSWKADLF